LLEIKYIILIQFLGGFIILLDEGVLNELHFDSSQLDDIVDSKIPVLPLEKECYVERLELILGVLDDCPDFVVQQR
jgi:hypothetical protein